MTHQEIRQRFIKFFEDKGHKLVPSSSLLPTDPSVLFTTAGMQQFKPYYTGEADPMKDFGSLNAVSIQKCLRTSDIDSVGDESHLTFFEMLGNFSFGGYFKEEAIKWAHEFITKEMGLKIDYVAVFDQNKVTKDDWRAAVEFPNGYDYDKDSYDIVKNQIGIPEAKILRAGIDNFWGPTGDKGPCGPTVEFYVDGVEVWNLVFNEFYCDKNKTLTLLQPSSGVDTGMGLERLAMASQKTPTIFETDLLLPIFKLTSIEIDLKTRRIIADHSRAVALLISDGVRPSNKELGYVLRRLMRRIITYNFIAKADITLMHDVFAKIAEMYGPYYSELNANLIIHEFETEKERFDKALVAGKKELKKLYPIKGIDPENLPPNVHISRNVLRVSGSEIYKIFESTGLHPELAQEIMKSWGMEFDKESLQEAEKIHQKLSRTASAGMFKGGLADTGVETIRLHTAAHLMLEALRRVLGEHVQQKGSNITAERLRFDFSHGEKMTPEQIQKVENIVNEQVRKDLPVHFEEMPVDEAKKIGATGVFEQKYGEKVKVYFVGKDGDYFSKEICGGPHVAHTGEIGHFCVTKEEAVGAGARRIRAVVQ